MTRDDFGTERVSRILLHLAPPVMLAQLIQALYNIVDSFFVGRYSDAGLTALSIIYPLQLLMIALAVGTGVGINTAIAHYLGLQDRRRAEEMAGTAAPLGLALWVLFAAVCYFILPGYARMSTDSEEVIQRRLATAREEVKELEHYDYIVINDTIENAVGEILAILVAEGCRKERRLELFKGV